MAQRSQGRSFAQRSVALDDWFLRRLGGDPARHTPTGAGACEVWATMTDEQRAWANRSAAIYGRPDDPGHALVVADLQRRYARPLPRALWWSLVTFAVLLNAMAVTSVALGGARDLTSYLPALSLLALPVVLRRRRRRLLRVAEDNERRAAEGGRLPGGQSREV